MRAELSAYSLPLFRPFRTSRTLQVARQGFWLQLRFADGLYGWGEAAGWPGFGVGEEAVAAARSVVERALHAAAPQIHTPPVASGEQRQSSVAWVSAAMAAVRGCSDAPLPLEWCHAIETALCDAAARQSDLPLAMWLSPRASQEVPVHVQVQSASEARAAVADGATHLKLKIGHRSRDDDGAHVAGVRAAVGDAVGLRLDANGAWGASVAERVACMLAAVSPEWIEQPCAAGNIEGLVAVGRTSRVPVAVDEGLVSPAALQAHLDAEAARIYVLKPLFFGGPLQTLAAARRVAARGADVCITHALESAIGTRAALHVAAAVRGELPAERVRAAGLHAMVSDPRVTLSRPERACLALGAALGLGLERADADAS